ncbi:MAG: type II secretion system protein [bacterium]|nr:type II secretion system protein [bacterium]
MRAAGEKHGFTLIEVLMAVLVVALVYGFLLEFVTDNLAALHRARSETEIARLSEQKLREVEARVLSGEELAESEDGAFEEPFQDYLFRVDLTPYQIPLPASFTGQIAPSKLFVGTGPQDPSRPALLRIEVRVYLEDEDPEGVIPFVTLAPLPNPQPPQADPRAVQGRTNRGPTDRPGR